MRKSTFKKGDIIISLSKKHNYRHIGSIHECSGSFDGYGKIYYDALNCNERLTSYDRCFRLATDIEASAYKQGIRHIKDIDTLPLYQIY